MIRSIIVDDERLGRLRLRRLLEREADIDVVAECPDGESAIALIEERVPDLLFLDIHMPGMDGFEVLERLDAKHHPPFVVFVTAYDEHAVHAFEVCAMDYLLKPVTAARLEQTLDRARELLAKDSRVQELGKSGESVTPQFTARGNGKISYFSANDVHWVGAAGNYAIFHLAGCNHMLRGTMHGLEKQLADCGFYRVSRSTILNLQMIQGVEAIGSGKHVAVMKNGQKIDITCPVKKFKRAVLSWRKHR